MSNRLEADGAIGVGSYIQALEKKAKRALADTPIL